MKTLKRTILLFCTVIITIAVATGCQASDKKNLKIYNWGEYMDMNVITAFEKKFNVKVIYDTYDSNEAMYNKLSSGAINYDVIFPSDYMAEKMIKENMLQPLDYSKIPNFTDIKTDLLHAAFDPTQTYSVPYFWGTVGIIYDTTKVKSSVDSWDILWDDTYKNDIFMYNSSRDSMMVALKKLGFSMNTTDKNQIEQAKAELIKQKPLVFGYVGDEVITSMINSQAALAVVYSGDATTIMRENENMAYAIPKEGSNIWVDPVVIPSTANEIDLAHEFINYLADFEIAKLNTEAVGYSTPNNKTLQLLEAEGFEWIDWLSYNPDLSTLNKMEFFTVGSDEVLTLYNVAWEDVISA